MLPAGTPVFLSAQIRAVESRAYADSPGMGLMERAGQAVADLAGDIVGEREKRILVLAGPGNNGGDAFVAARCLKQRWFDVRVVFDGDPPALPADARNAFDAWRDAGGGIEAQYPTGFRPGLVVDGLFGIGLRRPLQGAHAQLIDRVNASGLPVLAVDIPSGLHADTGMVLGTAVRARHTMTFLGLKAGLLTLDGPDHAGKIHVDNLGQDIAASEPGGAIIDADILPGVLRGRARNSHKGSYGSVVVIGGAPGMVGAALLAGRAALKLGAGKVRVGMVADGPMVDALHPELMLHPVQDLLALDDLDCLAAGPGLGTSQAAAHILALVLRKPYPVVLDADALNVLALDASLQQTMRNRQAAVLLTPHPAEAGRLLGVPTRDVQNDRIAAAIELASRLDAGVVLKGAGSVCAFSDGNWRINTSGNPGMASAGMGDVLTGIVAALIAQGADPSHALLAGVHLHGAAADRLAQSGIGPLGMTATEVIDAARACLNAAQAPPESD
jgi:hydroxyethylthiazole kinase-like uncharacterized protein yjeF